MAAQPGNRRLRRLTDERLAALVRLGAARAFEELYDRHHASLLAFCRHMVGNREDGEDALQQTFLRAHRALAAGRAPSRSSNLRPSRRRLPTLIRARSRPTIVALRLP